MKKPRHFLWDEHHYDEPLAYKDHDFSGNRCRKEYPRRYWRCTQRKGHKGMHEATDGTFCVARWSAAILMAKEL